MTHLFYEADDHHLACMDCDVLVDGHLVDAVTLECPVAPCPEPSNHGEPCVFIDGDAGPECSYCGRSGDPGWDESDGDDSEFGEK